jgi:hypothetical protein
MWVNPVNRRPVHIAQRGENWRCLTVGAQGARMSDLRHAQCGLASALHPAALHGLHAGAGAFGDQATLSLAQTPIICHMARPAAVSVSMCSVKERNVMPWARSASNRVMRSRKLQPQRSSFQTMRVSSGRRALRQRVSTGRFVVTPERPSSVQIVVQPAFFNAAC